MKKKIKVLYLTSENTTTSIPLELAEILRNDERIDIHTVTYYGRVKGDPIAESSTSVVDLNSSKKSFFDGVRKVAKIIKEVKPDVVHVHHNLSALVGLLLGKFYGVKLLIKTEHNDHRFFKSYQKLLNIPIFMLADIIICNSVSTQKSFYSWEKLLAGKNVFPIYNGIRVQKILQHSSPSTIAETRKKYNIEPNDILFVSVARLIKQKNFENLIKAFANASLSNNNIKLLIAGDGELRSELEKIILKHDSLNRISLIGVIPRDEVFKLINVADVFVMMSLWEGFCNAAVEAMAAACPMLCSDIVTLNEVVGEEVGRFADPLSVEDIGSKILQFASLSKHELKSLGELSAQRAQHLYAIETTAKNHVEQYLKVSNSL
jgi:glycosyltransferase involved in cell wall biosynthesis